MSIINPWIVVPGSVILLNIPFGYWRANVKKFSLQWFLSVHVPVPFVVLLRISSGLGWKWETYPLLVGSYFYGQFLGSRLHKAWSKRLKVTSCLIYDFIKYNFIKS